MPLGNHAAVLWRSVFPLLHWLQHGAHCTTAGCEVLKCSCLLGHCQCRPQQATAGSPILRGAPLLRSAVTHLASRTGATPRCTSAVQRPAERAGQARPASRTGAPRLQDRRDPPPAQARPASRTGAPRFQDRRAPPPGQARPASRTSTPLPSWQCVARAPTPDPCCPSPGCPPAGRGRHRPSGARPALPPSSPPRAASPSSFHLARRSDGARSLSAPRIGSKVS